jgi:hypothetical protein
MDARTPSWPSARTTASAALERTARRSPMMEFLLAASWKREDGAAVGRNRAAEEARISVAGLLDHSMVDLEAETNELNGGLRRVDGGEVEVQGLYDPASNR